MSTLLFSIIMISFFTFVAELDRRSSTGTSLALLARLGISAKKGVVYIYSPNYVPYKNDIVPYDACDFDTFVEIYIILHYRYEDFISWWYSHGKRRIG